MVYATVSTVRNEERFIHYMIQSVLSQTPSPDVYVLVDDGSTDDTGRIAEALDIEVLRIDVPRYPTRGINRVHAFKQGVRKASELYPDWRFLLNVDADVILPPSYIENLLAEMEGNPRLGICGGQPYSEKIRLSRVTNAARLYRRECWDQIGGVDYWTAFDTHALLKAQAAGWETKTFPEERYQSLRGSGKYTMKRWILTGFERHSFHLPLWHTCLAAVKNVKSGHPPIVGPLATILSHLVCTWPHAPNLHHDWMRHFAVHEVKEFFAR